MISQLQGLRKTFERATATTTTSPRRESPMKKETVVRTRPTASTRTNLIARAPEFEQIEEDDTEYDEAKRPDPQFIPLPEDEDEKRMPSPPLAADAITTRRKPLRRQSGLLGPAKARVSLSPDEVAPPSINDEDEVDELLSGTADAEEPPIASSSSVAKGKRRAKSTDGSAKGLKDVTNSPPRRGHTNVPPPQAIMAVLAEAVEEGQPNCWLTLCAPIDAFVQNIRPSRRNALPSNRFKLRDENLSHRHPPAIRRYLLLPSLGSRWPRPR